jgi:hypothetical protein
MRSSLKSPSSRSSLMTLCLHHPDLGAGARLGLSSHGGGEAATADAREILRVSDPVSLRSTTCQVRHRCRAMNAGRICQMASHTTQTWRTMPVSGFDRSARSSRDR